MVIGNGFFSENREAALAEMTERSGCEVKHLPYPTVGNNDKDVESAEMGIDEKGRVYFTFSVATEQGTETVDVYPKYQIGEQVAVAQSYSRIFTEADLSKRKGSLGDIITGAAWDNKMFVSPDLMPHVIEITNIKAERLQDISDEDCLKEGVTKWLDCYIVTGIMEHHGQNNVCFDTPREAFAALIDRLNGRGTWDKNEWQFAYTFKLIK